MATEDGVIDIEGSAVQALPETTSRVGLSTALAVPAQVSGTTGQHDIRTLPEDRVVAELGPYDLNRGRIVYRNE